MVAEQRLGAAELRELNRIGVNLNQMARAAPAGTREAVERHGSSSAADGGDELLAGDFHEFEVELFDPFKGK